VRPQVPLSIPAYSVDAHYALPNVLDQRPPYELSRLSDTYVLPRPQSKAQDCCFLRTSFEDLMRSDAASKFANEARSCRTRSTTTRSCLLSINTPCDHISASGTSSTHASALAKGLGTLRNRVLQRCCTTVLHYPSVRTTAHTHLILCRWTRQINGRHIAYSSQRRQPAGHRRHRRPDTDCPSTHQKIDRTVIRSA